jgi:hypothetical protein
MKKKEENNNTKKGKENEGKKEEKKKKGKEEEQPEIPKPPSAFGNWTGKTPVTQINEWSQVYCVTNIPKIDFIQRNRRPKPEFTPIKTKEVGFFLFDNALIRVGIYL